jgi:hypothetical protein
MLNHNDYESAFTLLSEFVAAALFLWVVTPVPPPPLAKPNLIVIRRRKNV